MKQVTKFESEILRFYESVISSIDTYSNEVKINSYDLRFEDNETSNYNVNAAITEGKTITKTLVIEVELNNKDGEIDTYTLDIPTPVNNIFVINGKTRINLNYLNNNRVCMILDKVIRLDSEYFIKINDKSKTGTIHKVTYKNFKKDSVEEIDSLDLTTVDERIAKKLKILYKLKEIPTLLTTELINTFIVPNHKLELRDHFCNKEIETTSQMFIRHLWESRFRMIKLSRGIFYRQNKGIISTATLGSFIDKFFNLRSITSVGIQVPNNINPITYSTMGNKIILSKGSDAGVSFSRINETYVDFVDMIVTPDNSNVNRSNELTRVLNINETGTYVKCYDLDFNPIEVPILDYIVANVLTSECVDYQDKKILNTSYIKTGCERIPNSDNVKVDYIELEPDMRLSQSVQMIPMINHSDSVRSSMGARMMGQSIEVIGCEPPLIASGHENVDSSLSVKSHINGKVIGMNKGVVLVRSNELNKDGEHDIVEIVRPSNLESMYGINISFNPRVKVGQDITEGDVIYSPNSIDGANNFNSGVNCKVALLNYKGFTYEDGVVMSETTARKFSHLSMIDLELIVTPDIRINGIRFPSLDKLNSSMPIVEYEIKLDKLGSKINKARKDLLGDQFYYRTTSLKLPLNTKEAYLLDSRFIEGTVPSNEDETIYHIEDGMISHKSVSNPPFDYDYKKLTDADFGDINSKGYSYRLKFRFLVVNHLEAGDKITSRYGSKGVNAIIVPDHEMPRMEDGRPIDCILNPAAPISRKNISQTMEQYLGKFTRHIKLKCRNMLVDKSLENPLANIRELLTKYKYKKYSSMSDEDLTNAMVNDKPLQVVTGCYSSINIDDILSWYKAEGLSEGTKLIDGKRGRPMPKEVIVGDIYLVKLYHLAGKKAQVTVDTGIKSKFVLGLGKESVAGLKSGNMETDAILAHNMSEYIKTIEGNDKLKSGWFLSHMINAGLAVEMNPHTTKPSS